jgi:predicted flap endonuclease-1-like 5' DNA nuclease
MWFLLLQITALILLAAGFGAWLMWWWLNRRFETVARSRELLVSQVSRIDGLVTREDLEKEAALLGSALAAQKPVDLQPLEEKFQRLQSSLGDMERKIAGFTLEPVMVKVSDVRAAVAGIRPTDIAPVEERLARVEAALRDFRMPEVDLGPVHSGLASLGLTVNAIEPASRAVEPIAARLAALETRLGDLGGKIEGARRNDMDVIAGRFATVTQAVANLRMPDVAPLQARLSEIQAAVANIPSAPSLQPVINGIADVQSAITAIPQPNLTPIKTSLSDLEAFVVGLDKPPLDLTPLMTRLASLESSLSLVQTEVKEARALQPIDRRLASLQEAMGSMPGPDLSPVIGAVRSIDSRNDLVAMENRLTAIEYGLAALHHMMRSRGDTILGRGDGDGRSAPPLHVVREAPPVAAPSAAPLRPDRDADPINTFLRAGDEANLLTEPAFGPADDLDAIDGVGPMLRALLNDLGVFYFWQVAEWTPREIDWVESKLMHFKGRIRRDDWVGHARKLAALPTSVKRPGLTAMRKPI